MTKAEEHEHIEEALTDEALAAVEVKRHTVYYTIGSNNPGETPWDVALYLWGKGSFGSDLVQANLSRDWEDGVEIVVPDLEF